MTRIRNVQNSTTRNLALWSGYFLSRTGKNKNKSNDQCPTEHREKVVRLFAITKGFLPMSQNHLSYGVMRAGVSSARSVDALNGLDMVFQQQVPQKRKKNLPSHVGID